MIRTAALLATALALAAPARAEGGAGNPSPSACDLALAACTADCQARYPDPKEGTGGLAGCKARCGTDHGLCQAGQAVDETLPRIDRALRQLQDFMREFFGPAKPPAPEGAPHPAKGDTKA